MFALPAAFSERVWGVAIGTDSEGHEKHFVVYSQQRGFAVKGRTRRYSTLRVLTEQNVAAQIALLHRVKIDRFERLNDDASSAGVAGF